MTQSNNARVWATGGMVFAAAMMLMLGIWQIIVGIAALVEDDFFVVAPNYTYEIDTTAWGWIHLVIGVVVAAAGLFLFTGAAWARAVGITLASLSAIANFFFLPYYPLWALVIIALDVFVIWALATARPRPRGDDLAAPAAAGYGSAGSRTGEDGWPTSGSRPAAPPAAR
jgi:hypothetical protein